MRRHRSMFHRSIFRADPNGDPDINTTPLIDVNRITIDTADVIRWNGEAIDLAQLGELVKTASTRPDAATLMFEPEARARYLRVDEAIGAIRRNGGSTIAFRGIQRYAAAI